MNNNKGHEFRKLKEYINPKNRISETSSAAVLNN